MPTASADGWNAKTWADTLEEVFRRASSDDVFRQKCLNDGNAAVEEVSGIKPPAGKKVTFFEKLDELQIALPPKTPTQSVQSSGIVRSTQTCFPWGSN